MESSIIAQHCHQMASEASKVHNLNFKKSPQITHFKIFVFIYRHPDAAEALEVHVHVVGHVGDGGLLSVVVVPTAKVIF